VHQIVAGIVGNLNEDTQARKVGEYLADPLRERGVVNQCGRTGVGEQVLKFVLDIALVDVERRHPGTPGAEHGLQVLGAVVGIDAQ
jgi:hypothetical protein